MSPAGKAQAARRFRDQALELLAYEMWVAAKRLSSVTNQVKHFRKLPKPERDMWRRCAKVGMRGPAEPTCIRCGCTHLNPCPDELTGAGCAWAYPSVVADCDAENNWGICTACLSEIDQGTAAALSGMGSLKAFHKALERAGFVRKA